MRKLVCLLAFVALSAGAQTLINAAGATFPYPIYSKWFDDYHKRAPHSRSTTSRSDPAPASSRRPKAPSTLAHPTAR